MKVLISVDLEGIAGIATRQQTQPTGRDYPAARRLMTAETNAAIAGAYDGGATAVVVADSHGPADNLIGEDLDPRATYVVGEPRPFDMVQEVTPETGVVLFVGYHAGAADSAGVLAHTYSGAAFADVRVNGHSISEAELNALMAADLGVPVGLVTGDDVICGIAEKAFPGVVTVAVKTAVGRTAARSLNPLTARDAVRAGAAQAVGLAVNGELQPIDVPAELVIEAVLRPSGVIELMAMVPDCRRTDSRTIQFTASSPRQAMDVLNVWAALARPA